MYKTVIVLLVLFLEGTGSQTLSKESEKPESHLRHTQNTHTSKESQNSTCNKTVRVIIENLKLLPNPESLSKKLSLFDVTVTAMLLVANLNMISALYLTFILQCSLVLSVSLKINFFNFLINDF